MSRIPLLRLLGPAVGLLVLLAAPVFGDSNDPLKYKPRKADPPGTSQIMAELRGWFAATDKNKDGYLDKEELAKAFRGPSAKPYDAAGKSKSTKAKDDDDEDDKDTKKPSSTKSTRKRNYTKYADYVFLKAADTNDDGKVSREEFETWARGFAVQLKQSLSSEERIAQAEQKLGQKLTAAEEKQIQAEIKQEQKILKAVQKQLKAFDHQLLKALKASTKVSTKKKP